MNPVNQHVREEDKEYKIGQLFHPTCITFRSWKYGIYMLFTECYLKVTVQLHHIVCCGLALRGRRAPQSEY